MSHFVTFLTKFVLHQVVMMSEVHSAAHAHRQTQLVQWEPQFQCKLAYQHRREHSCRGACVWWRHVEFSKVYPTYRNIKWNSRVMVHPCGRHKIDIEQQRVHIVWWHSLTLCDIHKEQATARQQTFTASIIRYRYRVCSLHTAIKCSE